MATLRYLGRLAPNLKLCCFRKNSAVNNAFKCAMISTSKKTKDGVMTTVIEGYMRDAGNDPEAEAAMNKNWVSWGYSEVDIVEDRTSMHMVFFCLVTLCFIGGGFILMYMPDNKMQSWIQRESFLELRRREAEGLPLVDKDLIPLDKIELPTDEELGNVRIII